MHNASWSPSEKKLARRVYEAALERELAELVAEVKAKASAIQTPEDVWLLEEYLRERRRDIGEKYDYRYSMLLLVFARLIREGHVSESDLAGLSEEKRGFLHEVLSL